MAKRKPLRVLILFDAPEPVLAHEMPTYMKRPDRRTEADVAAALAKRGFEVSYFGLSQDVKPLIEELTQRPPDVVFNQCEAFDNDRFFDPHVAALLEMLRVPFTGARSGALSICKDKALAKKVLGFHEFKVPEFFTLRKGASADGWARLKSFAYPALIKPLSLEASEGISMHSLVHDEKSARERVHFVHERFGVDAIVEQYIHGREIYVSVLGNERLVAFPPRELLFKEVPDAAPRIATYKAKWDEGYRKRWGIRGANARNLSAPLKSRILEACKGMYRSLGLTGYGRLDLRITEDEQIYFIEANPNPAIGKTEDFARSAAEAGLGYEDLIARLVKLAA